MKTSDRNSGDSPRFRLRSDLEFVDYAIGFDRQLVVKDPLRLQYFMLGPMEKLLLMLLKTPMSVFELKQAADQQLVSERFQLSQIRQLLRRLLNDNLVVVESTGSGPALRQLAHRDRRLARWQQWFGILAIRFRGINPQGMLDVFNPCVSWIFHPVFLALTFCGFLAALLTMALNFNRIAATDTIAQLADPATIAIIAVALGIVKVLHELGHAFACRSIGRDCHELGVMLLAFVPCLYCNVSDIWMEPSRWRRILVSVAGIYLEMLIAVICVPLWLVSQTGPMQTFWLAMIMICSVNTLLINGNPLLRYDGYYVLSDLLQIPNLYSQSQQALNQRIAGFFTRTEPPVGRFGFLEAYALLARAYRLFVIAIILLAIYSFFAVYQLDNLGLTLAGVILVMTFAPSWWRNVGHLTSTSFWSSLRMARTILFTGLVVMLLGLLLLLPVTTRTLADGRTELADARIIYATQTGRVHWFAGNASQVKANQLVGWIENHELEAELLEQQQRIEQLELSSQNQQLLQRQGADNTGEIELQNQLLASARQIAVQLLQRKEQLNLRAMSEGKLVALPIEAMDQTKELDLSRRSSSLAAENTGCSVERGEALAAVFDPDAVRVRLQVPESSINRIAVNDNVRLVIPHASPEYRFGMVQSIDIEKPNRQFNSRQGDGEPAEHDSIGVVVRLLETCPNVLIQSPVKACVYGEQMPLYKYLWQQFTANLDL